MRATSESESERASISLATKRGDGLGFVARRFRREQRGPRLDAIEHQEPEPERERAHDAAEGQEDLHANGHSRRARAHEPRRR